MSDLVGNPEDRFSRVAAQILIFFKCEKDMVKLQGFFSHSQHFLNINQYCGKLGFVADRQNQSLVEFII